MANWQMTMVINHAPIRQSSASLTPALSSTFFAIVRIL